MKKNLLNILLVLVIIIGCNSKSSRITKVLVFFETTENSHPLALTSIKTLEMLGMENNFEIDTTSNSHDFSDRNLTKYSAVVFLNTNGKLLGSRHKIAFERYIQSGGGVVGIGAATNTNHNWGWYRNLVGVTYNSGKKIVGDSLFIKDFDFYATNFFTDTIWKKIFDINEYNKIKPSINVLITVDKTSLKGKKDSHPISWYHKYDGGRSFNTVLGHDKKSYTDRTYLSHLLGGIQYAIGENKPLDYANAKSQNPPADDRFTKIQLSPNGSLFEPTEMTILPNLDILVAQRRGEIMLYKNKTKKLYKVGHLDVYWKTLNTPDVNAEEGVMGLQKDPNYKTNHWIYVYYSPTGENSVNRLSRFTFKNDNFDLESEKIILEIESQREICCHTGGSIAFGPEGLLYLSTGDNSTPFNEKDAKFVNNGFAPLNDTKGHRQYDALRSAGNTNDLRGKIVRIKVNDDGTYAIPNGNLFPIGQDKTRPEIYTMGHRNPYRISIDQKNNYLYWGDVGPDAVNDSLSTRGAKGYDEINQARQAGNYGWPLFIANNLPYVAYDYSLGKSGKKFHPDEPLNTSRNNTGLIQLPTAKPAYIWYSYHKSLDLPELGSGARSTAVGPVYYSSFYPPKTALPEYYDGKLFIYDWIRSWIKVVSMFPNGDFNKIEPFAPEIKIEGAIDMEVGPDGRVYILEYGRGYFSQNEGSGLSVITYTKGNRPPAILEFELERTSGEIPFSLIGRVNAKDPEKDEITYLWDLGNGETKKTKIPNIEYTYENAGEYKVSVSAVDSQNASISSTSISITVGNTRPEVQIDILSNSSFHLPDHPIEYSVTVVDDYGTVDKSNIFVSMDYMDSSDKAALSPGHQEGTNAILGKTLTQSMDCKSCHKENAISIGPSFMDISKKYQTGLDTHEYLKTKIIKGGKGVWGGYSMPAHPNIKKNEVSQIVSWIRSLAEIEPHKESLPASGRIYAKATSANSSIVLTASYTDKGGYTNKKPLTGENTLVLPSSAISLSGAHNINGLDKDASKDTSLWHVTPQGGWLSMNNVDLTGVTYVNIMAEWLKGPKSGLNVEIRLDSAHGELLGTGRMKKPIREKGETEIQLQLKGPENLKSRNLYFVFNPSNKSENLDGSIMLKSVKFK